MRPEALPAPTARRGARGRAPGERLRQAVAALAGKEGAILSHSERSWASITFAGTRHRLVLAFAGPGGVPAGETFIEALPDHEFAIPGHLVADAAIVEVDHCAVPEARLQVTVELLLLEDS